MHVKVLIVEDELVVRNGISNFIKDMGQPFVLIGTASNGEEALKIIQAHSPHIIITDIKMPKMDGLTLVKSVKKMYPEIIFAILSGYADFTYATKAMRYGVSDYLLKPINKEVFGTTLNRLMAEVVKGSIKYSHLLQNQPKWDMGLIRLESDLLDCVEMANQSGLNDKAQLFIGEIRKRSQNDTIKAIPYLTDFLVSLRKRVITNDEIRGFIEPIIEKTIESLVPETDFSKIVEKVHRLLDSSVYIVSQYKKTGSPDLTIRCKEIMDANYNKEISLQEVAEIIGVSAAHLSRVVKKELGKNFTEYIVDLRMEKAKNMLETTKFKVMDISKTVGYESPDYFSRIFKRQCGLTPQDYRSQFLIKGGQK
ncbi:response regulator [Neobacillus jeddahensis]|uniref:response regulator n=1 Tax=Neobacillus jeddahensis TaxID=1461580 RepID=UPI00058D7C1B|nr:response regulator [Neobacillus jeddahensis]